MVFTLVFAGGRPSSYFLFLWQGFRLPPVLRRLCQLSLEIPGSQKRRGKTLVRKEQTTELTQQKKKTVNFLRAFECQFSKVFIRTVMSETLLSSFSLKHTATPNRLQFTSRPTVLSLLKYPQGSQVSPPGQETAAVPLASQVHMANTFPLLRQHGCEQPLANVSIASWRKGRQLTYYLGQQIHCSLVDIQNKKTPYQCRFNRDTT